MHTTREQFDPDRDYTRGNYSKLPTVVNHFNMYCSSCHGSFYVDKDFYQRIVTAMEEGLDNPFVCDDCQGEFEELEHMQGH